LEASGRIGETETHVYSMLVEMAGAPAVATTLHIGKSDGLPYAETSAGTQTRYRYGTNLEAPSETP